jgi:hypothetical protein
MKTLSEEQGSSKLSIGGWIIICALLILLGAAGWYGIRVWTSMPGVRMSGWGWFTLVLGVVVTFGLGTALMTLVFYSSRHDFDQ